MAMHCVEIASVVKGAISIFGIIGNVLAFCTAGKMRNQNASTILIRALAFVDSYLLLIAPMVGIPVTITGVWEASFFIVVVPLTQIVRTASIWTPVLLGFHRYMAVCKPLVAARMCTPRKARIHLGCVLAFSLIVNIPLCLRFRRDIARSQWYTIGYNLVFRMILILYITPVVSLVFFTVRLVQTLHYSRQWRVELREGQTQHQSERMMNLMVIVVLIMFTLCHTPSMMWIILAYLGIIKPSSMDYCTSAFFILLTVCSMLIVLNSSVNCIIYSVFSRNFRRTLCQCCRQQSTNQQPATEAIAMTILSTD